MIDLQELRRKFLEATPGPWEYFDRYCGRGAVWNGDDPITDTSLEHPGMDTACVLRRDGVLIAAMYNALPKLLDIAEAAIADAADREPDSWCEPGGCQNCDRLRAALAEVAGG